MKKTQIDWTRARLARYGFVSRNHALRMYISRLGAIIFKLRAEGMRIDGGYVKTKNGRDYQYFLVK